jgi:hypothetical protein
MPAISADIGPALRAAVTGLWSDSAVKTRFPSAVDGAADPRAGYFDAKADAETAAAQAAILQGVARRRFSAVADGVILLDPSTGLPIVKLYDSDQAFAGFAITSRIEIDLDAERTNLELYG